MKQMRPYKKFNLEKLIVNTAAYLIKTLLLLGSIVEIIYIFYCHFT